MTTALVECPNCKKLNPLENEHVHLQCLPFTFYGKEYAEYIEMGTRCQHCQKWIHFGYYTPELIERQKQLTNRRKQRAFRRDFDNFQLEIETMLASPLEV